MRAYYKRNAKYCIFEQFHSIKSNIPIFECLVFEKKNTKPSEFDGLYECPESGLYPSKRPFIIPFFMHIVISTAKLKQV